MEDMLENEEQKTLKGWSCTYFPLRDGSGNVCCMFSPVEADVILSPKGSIRMSPVFIRDGETDDEAAQRAFEMAERGEGAVMAIPHSLDPFLRRGMEDDEPIAIFREMMFTAWELGMYAAS